MNKALLISFTILSTTAFSQNWAAPGATWHYDYFGNDGNEGYVLIEKIGDTLINSIECDVLNKMRYTYDHVTEEYELTLLGHDYTYKENNTVYYFRNEQFYILYDFSANVGDAWLKPANDICESDSVRVESTTTVIINDTPLQKLHVSSDNDESGEIEEIIEKIGSTSFMFPTYNCVEDLNEGGSLRCYNDSAGWNYQTRIADACDEILDEQTGLLQITSIGFEMSLFPNPAQDETNIVMPFHSNWIYRITDIGGRVHKRGRFIADRNKLDLTQLNSGFYIIEVREEGDIRRGRVKLIKD